MDTAPSTVQRVTKASSDKLLKKFAQVGGSKSGERQLAKRRRKVIRPPAGESDDQWLLPPVAEACRRSVAVIRRIAIGKSRLRARVLKNKSILGTIEKTWRRTVEGASKVFLEKHHNRHKRLINEIA